MILCVWLFVGSTVLENQVRVELHAKGEPAPRYILHVIDRPGKNTGIKFAIFIVPQGRYVYASISY